MIKFVLLFFLIFPLHSFSDEARPVYIEIIENSETNLELKWKLPPVMLSVDEPSIELISDRCREDGNRLGTRLLGRAFYTCNQLSREITVSIDYPNANPALTSLVVYKKYNGAIQQIFSSPDVTSILIGSEKSFADIARQYIIAGIEHILIGFDHLLFVLCLILIASTTKQLILAITGFTIAHSITLSLATMNILKVRTELVELLIALSIVVLAREIITAKRNLVAIPFSVKYPISISSFFGLLHGFGFAVVLQELGLPFDMKINALMFFNIGVEIGQLMFIALIFIVIYLVTNSRLVSSKLNDAFSTFCVSAIGAIGTFWFLQRTLQLI